MCVQFNLQRRVLAYLAADLHIVLLLTGKDVTKLNVAAVDMGDNSCNM